MCSSFGKYTIVFGKDGEDGTSGNKLHGKIRRQVVAFRSSPDNTEKLHFAVILENVSSTPRSAQIMILYLSNMYNHRQRFYCTTGIQGVRGFYARCIETARKKLRSTRKFSKGIYRCNAWSLQRISLNNFCWLNCSKLWLIYNFRKIIIQCLSNALS